MKRSLPLIPSRRNLTVTIRYNISQEYAILYLRAVEYANVSLIYAVLITACYFKGRRR